MDIVVVMPALNAASMLPEAVQELIDVGFPNIVIVNDGSRDGTSRLSFPAPVSMLSHSSNKGVGAALRTGLAHARDTGARRVLTIGADLQRDARDCLQLAKAAMNEADLVIGVKRLSDPGIPTARRLGNFVFRELFNLRSAVEMGTRALRIEDVVSGFRVMSPRAIDLALTIPDEGYTFDVAFLRSVVRAGLRIVQVPVSVRYHSRSSQMRSPIRVGISIAHRIITAR